MGDVFLPKQPKHPLYSMDHFSIKNLTDFVSPFNQKLNYNQNNMMLQLEYNYDFQSEWINNEQFYDIPDPIYSIYKPLNTDKSLVAGFRSILDLQIPTNKALETNLTANNYFYDLFMNKQCIDLVNHVITNDIENALFISNSFHSSFDPKDIPLSKGAKRLLYEDNAGGCSELSEAFSFQVLKHCFAAKLLKTEMAIKYCSKNCKITDYLISGWNGTKIGVSVTRAMKYKGIFNEYDALRLLSKKIKGVNQSTINVQECDQWKRQILHIWTTNDYIQRILYRVFQRLILSNPSFIGNTIILVTVASEDMWWLFRQHAYINKKCSNKKKKKKKKQT